MARLKKKILKASNINQMIFEKKIRHCYTTFLLFICRITSIQVFNVFICETLPIQSHREPPPHYGPFPHLHSFLRLLAPLASQVVHSNFIDGDYRPAATSTPCFEECACFWFSLSWYDETFFFFLERCMVLCILSETHDILSSEMRWLIFVNINLVIYISKIRNFSNY